MIEDYEKNREELIKDRIEQLRDLARGYEGQGVKDVPSWCDQMISILKHNEQIKKQLLRFLVSSIIFLAIGTLLGLVVLGFGPNHLSIMVIWLIMIIGLLSIFYSVSAMIRIATYAIVN
ncbi:MAG TPA: hypothetical protein VJL27_01025 [Patescibacteria group bacterium]|nr:hypothetical protein [Patescibacteria group bacterium]